MAAVNILKYAVSSPADTSPLQQLKRAGYEATQVLAIVGKTEGRFIQSICLYMSLHWFTQKAGNGCVNDFSRTLSSAVWEPLLPPDAVTVFSGGTEGVLSPHVTFVVKESDLTTTNLRASAGRTRILRPDEVGTAEHARQVKDTIRRLLEAANISQQWVHLVLIKCPLLTSRDIAFIKASGNTPLTTDTYESMAKSRYASAVGIAAALGEMDEGKLEAAMSADAQIWSARASCSSGAELQDCHILMLASPPNAEGHLRAVSGYMKDAIDAPSIMASLEKIQKDHGAVVQVFAKAEPDPTGTVRGKRHTMNTDSDIHGTRHARAAVGGLLAGLTGDTEVYVSGGAEGQGPPGGGGFCIVYRAPA